MKAESPLALSEITLLESADDCQKYQTTEMEKPSCGFVNDKNLTYMTLRNMVQAQILGCSVISLGSLAFKAGAENTAPNFLTRTSAKVSSSLKASKRLNASNQASGS